MKTEEEVDSTQSMISYFEGVLGRKLFWSEVVMINSIPDASHEIGYVDTNKSACEDE